MLVAGDTVVKFSGELEEDPEDLIGEGESGEVDEASLYFGWKKREGKYRLVD